MIDLPCLKFTAIGVQTRVKLEKKAEQSMLILARPHFNDTSGNSTW